MTFFSRTDRPESDQEKRLTEILARYADSVHTGDASEDVGFLLRQLQEARKVRARLAAFEACIRAAGRYSKDYDGYMERDQQWGDWVSADDIDNALKVLENSASSSPDGGN